MAKRKRTVRAKNKINPVSQEALVKVDPEPLPAVPAEVYHSRAVTIVRTTLFSAEFEKVIEIIARERVYRAMLAGLGRRLLMSPPQTEVPRIISE